MPATRFPNISTPKLPRGHRRHSSLYDYYAGYSINFVRDVVEHFGLASDQPLLDPWNGAGTTTHVAHELGLTSWGGDANPAMVVVAKAKLVGREVTPSELTLGDSVLDIAGNATDEVSAEDPLCTWFVPAAARELRRIERAVGHMLDPEHREGPPASELRVSSLSPLAAFFYLALFRTVRDLVTSFVASNPTWVKRPAEPRHRLNPDRRRISSVFRHHVAAMARATRAFDVHEAVSDRQAAPRRAGRAQKSVAETPRQPQAGRTTIAVADSTRLPLAKGSIAAVVASPPYCTRIDYAVATAPELAVLGFCEEAFSQIRSKLIGTSVVRTGYSEVDFGWGPTCAEFLGAVASHQSKASSGYYLRNHLQYFDGLSASLREIDRVLQCGAPCVLVVQDSYYKDVHNNLPRIIEEMGDALGWIVEDRRNYNASNNLARVNARIRRYRTAVSATESVIAFRTGG